MVITSISDPASNLAIVIFIGGFLANLGVSLYGWWQAVGKYGKYEIKITFDPKVIFTAIGALIPIFIATYATFNHLMDQVTTQDPISYFAAFGMAFGLTAIANFGTNKILLPDPLNSKQAPLLKEKQIQEAVSIHKFNQSLKKENESSA